PAHRAHLHPPTAGARAGEGLRHGGRVELPLACNRERAERVRDLMASDQRQAKRRKPFHLDLAALGTEILDRARTQVGVRGESVSDYTAARGCQRSKER